MKKTFAQILNIFMAFVVLTSSIGVSYFEHSCRMLGKKIYTFSTPKTCAEDLKNATKSTNQTSIKKASCCKDVDKYQQMSYVSNLAKIVAKFVQAITNVFASVNIFSFKFIGLLVSINISFYTFTDLPISGRDILVLIQSFLI